MHIKSEDNLKAITGWLHDSEFGPKDFYYDCGTKVFYLKSRSCAIDVIKIEFVLELHKVEKYEAVNLDKIISGEATGGVFETIEIKNKGLDLTIISLDLKIELLLSSIDGKFEINQMTPLLIKSVHDMAIVRNWLSGTFNIDGLKYTPDTKIFCLTTSLPEIEKKLVLQFYNVEKYHATNLEMFKNGMLEDIKIKKHGSEVVLISKPLKIILSLTNLDGKFEII